jgi:hypothetical protein
LAEELDRVFGEDNPSSFQASMGRLKTAWDDLMIAIGDTGAFDLLSAGVEGGSQTLQTITEWLKLASGQVGIFIDLITGNLTPSEAWQKFQDLAEKTGDNFEKLTQKTWGVKDAAAEATDIIGKFLTSIDTADAEGLEQIKTVLDTMYQDGTIDAETYEAIQNAILQKAEGKWPEVAKGIESAGDEMGKLGEASKETDKALKGLGLDPDKIGDQTDKILGHFQTLAESAGSSGEQILAGLLVAIDQVDQSGLPQLSASLDKAFAEGKISADQYAAGLNAIETAMGGVWPEAEKAAGAVDKQAKSLKDAEKAALDATKEANNYAIAMAKIEADLAGKVIESKVKLDVAQIEADAKVATAIIDSITQTIGDTQGFISDLAGMLSKSMGSPKDMYLKNLMDDAAKRTKELHDQQMKLVQAQVDYMTAKTSAIANGNSLVTIQADGLQPHLESFMWEILKAIQVKMAYDGGDMLVGGCSL